MTNRPLTLSITLASSLLMLSGCGTTHEASPSGSPTGGDVPSTAQALAYVAAEHAGAPSSATTENDAAEEFASQAVGTELRFGSAGVDDGDALAIAVGKGWDPT